MEKTKIYTQTVISGNVMEWVENPDRGDELYTVELRQIEMTEAEYEAKMKDPEEREKRIKEILTDMMAVYVMNRRYEKVRASRNDKED